MLHYIAMAFFIKMYSFFFTLLPLHIMNSQEVIKCSEIHLNDARFIVGKEFTGSYENTSAYLDNVKAELKKNAIAFDELQAVSVYLSDPATDKPSNLKSFQGFVATKEIAKTGNLLSQKLTAGKYIIARTKNAKLVWQLFEEAYKYASQHKIKTSNLPPVVITTVEENMPVFSLYLLEQ
jgi:DNA gyrase inhibitor GyrI